MRIRLIICISKEEKYSPKMETNNSFCLTFLFPKTFHLSIFVSWKLSPLHGSVQSLKHEHVFFFIWTEGAGVEYKAIHYGHIRDRGNESIFHILTSTYSVCSLQILSYALKISHSTMTLQWPKFLITPTYIFHRHQ